MKNNTGELKEIFEYELKTKLTEKAKTSIGEHRTLLNCFKYYDLNKEGFVDESNWINSILRTGITGFSQKDLELLYRSYVSNPSDSIDYQNFCDYIFDRENLSKASYIKIKSEKMKTDIRSNNNSIRNNFQNIDLNKYNRTYLNKQKEYENVSSSNTQGNNNYEILLEKLKEKINTNNGMTYYSFIKNLKTNEETLSQTVSIDELSISLQQLHLNITSNDIYDFFNYLDTEKIGRISTNEIINIITEPINERRKTFLNKVFKTLDTEKKGEISINKLKNVYHAKNHPDVLNNNKNEDEIYNQFCYTLDIFIRVNNILNYSINNEQFIYYYSGISPSIKEDEEFEEILGKVWDIYKKQNEKKKYYNIIYKNNYEDIGENNEMGMNSFFFGESHSQRPKYDYDYDYLEEFYKSSSNISNKYNKVNKNKNKYYLRNKTQEDLNKNNTQKKYFLYESDNAKDNYGIKVYQKKRRYNPITDEYIQENNSFNNGNNKIVNDILNNNNKKQNEELIKEEINKEEDNSINNNNINIKNNFKSYNYNNYTNIKENDALIKFRQLLISQGVKGIFHFQKMLIIYDRNNSGYISFDNFLTIFQVNYTNISLSDIKSIFALFEKDNKAQITTSFDYKIKYDLLIKSLVGNLSLKRRILIQKVFNSFNKDRNEKILITDIKNRFNSARHPDIITGKKTANKVLSEFLDFLQTFREYNNNLHGGYNYNMSFKEFCDFYTQISLSINDDNYFEIMINNCWDLSDRNDKEENSENINIDEKRDIIKDNNDNKIYKENKQYDKNIRMKTGTQIINDRFFY